MTRQAGSRSVVLLVSLAVGAAVACDSSPSSPSTHSQGRQNRQDVPQGALTASGRVVGTVTGEPIAGATITVGTEDVVTDQDGAFRLSDLRPGIRDVTITGAGIVARQTSVSFGERDATIDVIQNRPPFELTFFRQLGRNALESDRGLEPLRPLPAAPRIHLRTVDEAGRPIDAAILDLVEASLRDVAPAWSAARHPLEIVQRGPEIPEDRSGWIVVLFAGERVPGGCGKATLGSTTGRIELYYLNDTCSCDGHVVAPRTVRHELGHVYGYWHTSLRGGVMSRSWTTRQCDGRPSAREIEHAKYMYSRTSGNLDPDTDPGVQPLREPREIVIED